jgi:AcrR family transcriptional regulator
MSRERWASEALKVLARGGLPALAVEPLARRLGVTKGSFYWHYSSRDALLEAALLRWEQNNQAALAELERAHDDPQQRLRALFFAAFQPSALGGLLLQLMSVRDHELVAPVLQRVTAMRLDHLTRLYTQAGLDADGARHRALLSYSAYVGIFEVMATAPERAPVGSDLDAYLGHMVSALMP